MKLIPPSAPFCPIEFYGESLTVSTGGNLLVLPTGNMQILKNINEYTISTDRTGLSPGFNILTNDYNTDTGILNLYTPWIAICNTETNTVSFFLFTNAPIGLDYTVNNEGMIQELTLYPDNGTVYYGNILFPSLSQASDLKSFFNTGFFNNYFNNDYFISESSLIPDIFSIHHPGSLLNFLQGFSSLNQHGAAQFITADGFEFMTQDSNVFFSPIHRYPSFNNTEIQSPLSTNYEFTFKKFKTSDKQDFLTSDSKLFLTGI